MPSLFASQEQPLSTDQFITILKVCQSDEPLFDSKPSETTSLKLDLRAIREVEAMEGYATEEDFDELLFMPKIQAFIAMRRHEEQEIRVFWMMLRIRRLALLRRPQRAYLIQEGEQISYKPTLVITEFYKLSNLSDRLRLLSHLSYRDFAGLVAETDQRELTLQADGGEFLSSIASHKQNSEFRQSARRTFLAR